METHAAEILHFVIVTRYYPPEISGGARRPFLYVKALRGLGHKVTIVSPFGDPGDPDHIKVAHPVSHITATDNHDEAAETITAFDKLRTVARTWLLWPDPEIRWSRRVQKHLTAQNISADWVITTSPPVSLHCIGARIAKALNAKWLAEFRDTWIENPHRKIVERSAIRRLIEKTIAKRSLRKVDAVTSVSGAVMDDVRAFIPKDTSDLIVGHFSDFSGVEPYAFSGPGVHVFHAGGFSLSDRQRDLEPVLEALKESGRADLHFHIAGRLSASELALIAAVTGFKVTHHGPVPLERSLAMQLGADALVLVTPKDSHALPGKYAEYALTGKPILFHGGGAWLDLIDDPEKLLTLEKGAALIQKDKTPRKKAVQGNAGLAAAKLAAFCQALT